MTKDKELEIIEAYKRIELDPNAFDNENTNIIKELYVSTLVEGEECIACEG